MSPKELVYIEDALGHEKHLQQKCTQVTQQLSDSALKQFASQLATERQELFASFYNLV